MNNSGLTETGGMIFSSIVFFKLSDRIYEFGSFCPKIINDEHNNIKERNIFIICFKVIYRKIVFINTKDN